MSCPQNEYESQITKAKDLAKNKEYFSMVSTITFDSYQSHPHVASAMSEVVQCKTVPHTGLEIPLLLAHTWSKKTAFEEYMYSMTLYITDTRKKKQVQQIQATLSISEITNYCWLTFHAETLVTVQSSLL